MSRVCDLTGVAVMSGHNVSHSVRRTKRKFIPNLQKKVLTSDVLGSNITLTIAAKTLRTINKYGGLDAFLINYRFAKLTDTAKTLRNQVKKALIKKKQLDTIEVKKERKVRRVSARKAKLAKKSIKITAEQKIEKKKAEKKPLKKAVKKKKAE
jgi:large subunit ribosomal protein L28